MPGKRLGGVVGAAIASYCACSSSASWSDHVVYADGFFRFPPFSSSSSATTHDDRQPSDVDDAYKKNQNEEMGKVGGKSSGFDPESLERGAKALREINSSPHAKQVFDIMRRQEDTRMLELHVERTHFQANQSLAVIVGGFKALLTDRTKLTVAVGGATAVAAGVYTTREGARVMWGYINRILGQPSLIRESSMPRLPWGSKLLSRGMSTFSLTGKSPVKSGSSFDNIILHPSLKKRIEQLARATANTRSHQAPFRNMLFYGPPGTGKTMVAREMARKSGLDYAMMTGGDVAPLGSQAVTKIHQLFDWAKKSTKGLLLFIDEADAFLCERNSIHMSESQRSALNALLFRTGDQSRDIVLVLATNRPGDLDSAITDRIDEIIEFPLPGEEERFNLVKLYLCKYILSDNSSGSKWGSFYKQKQQKITLKDVSDDAIHDAAKKTAGFSGREIAKLMASIQASVYGRRDCTLVDGDFS